MNRRLYILVLLCFTVSAIALPPILQRRLNPPVKAVVKAAAAPPAGISYVQGKGGLGTINAASVTFDSTPTAGNVIVVGFASYQLVSQGDVTDNKGNVYNLIVKDDAPYSSIFVASNIVSSPTFTVTVSHASSYPAIACSEWSGVNNSSPVSGSGSNYVSSATPSCPSLNVVGASVAILGIGDPKTMTQGAWATGLIYEYEADGNSMSINCCYGTGTGSIIHNWTATEGYYGLCAISLQ